MIWRDHVFNYGPKSATRVTKFLEKKLARPDYVLSYIPRAMAILRWKWKFWNLKSVHGDDENDSDNYDDDDDDDDDDDYDGADHLQDILPSWSWSAKLNISSISSSNTGTGRFLIISCGNLLQQLLSDFRNQVAIQRGREITWKSDFVKNLSWSRYFLARKCSGYGSVPHKTCD